MLSNSSSCTSNNSFKPNLLRYTNNMAGKACHVVASATQVGLTQVLALQRKIICKEPSKGFPAPLSPSLRP